MSASPADVATAAPLAASAAAAAPAVSATSAAPAAPAEGAGPAARRDARPGPFSTSTGRALLLGAAALVLTLAIGLWLFSWARQQGPRASVALDRGGEANRAALLRTMQEGRRLLESGDPRGAAVAYSEARPLVPAGSPLAARLQRRIADAERQAGERDQRLNQERTLALKLDEARADLAGRRYDEADAAAAVVLQMSPGNTAAEAVKSAVQSARQRARDRSPAAVTAARQAAARPPDPSAAALPSAVAAQRAAAAAPGTAAEPPRDATLHLAFHSALPAGTVMLYVNNRRVLIEPFSFYEKGGLGGLFHTKPSTGWVRRDFSLSPGPVDIRLYVTPQGRAAKVHSFPGNSFSAGTSHSLEVQLTESGEVSYSLN